MTRSLYAVLLILACAAAQAASQNAQLVLVLTDAWKANQGALFAYERSPDGWRAHLAHVAVAIGQSGSAWGIGLHGPQQGPQKREGDGRSPAGMFGIGTAFGYAKQERTGIAYRALSEFDYCIDAGGSAHYNRIVDSRTVDDASIERSTEPMRRDIHLQGDRRYELGFVVEHNPRGIPARGSCIFAHLWAASGQTTAGCTAMDERSLRELLAWLDEAKHPIFVLLPRAEYRRLRTQWNLPDVSARK